MLGSGEPFQLIIHERVGFPCLSQPPNSRVRGLLWERWLSTLVVDDNSLKRCLSPRLLPEGASLLPPLPPAGLSPRLKVSAHSLFQLPFRGESGAEIPHPHRQSWPKPNRLGRITDKSQSPAASGLLHPLSLCLCHPLPPPQMSRCSSGWLTCRYPREKMDIFLG